MTLAAASSFDIVSKFDRQELKNAVDQADRELRQRYDLKDTNTELTLNENDITINTESEYSLDAVKDMLESKLVSRKLSLKIFEYKDPAQASGGRLRQVITLKQGIADDIAKQITKRIRDEFKKVTPQIQGDAIRVQAKSRDDLQGVITALRDADYPVALQFENYR